MSTKGQERTKGVRDCPAEWPPSAFSAETLHLSSFVGLKGENFVSELRMSTKGQERTKGVRDCPAEWPPSAFSITKFSPLSEHHLYLLARQHHYSFHLFRPFMAQNVFFLANDLKSVIFEQTADIGYGMDEPPGRR